MFVNIRITSSKSFSSRANLAKDVHTFPTKNHRRGLKVFSIFNVSDCIFNEATKISNFLKTSLAISCYLNSFAHLKHGLHVFFVNTIWLWVVQTLSEMPHDFLSSLIWKTQGSSFPWLNNLSLPAVPGKVNRDKDSCLLRHNVEILTHSQPKSSRRGYSSSLS